LGDSIEKEHLHDLAHKAITLEKPICCTATAFVFTVTLFLANTNSISQNIGNGTPTLAGNGHQLRCFLRIKTVNLFRKTNQPENGASFCAREVFETPIKRHAKCNVGSEKISNAPCPLVHAPGARQE